MKKGITKILSLALCMTMLMGFMLPDVAFAKEPTVKTINAQEATFSCLTLNDSLWWFFGRTSTVTFTNKGKSLSVMTIDASATGCSVSPKTATLGSDASVTFRISTPFGGNGKVLFDVKELMYSNIKYTIEESGTQMIIRTK